MHLRRSLFASIFPIGLSLLSVSLCTQQAQASCRTDFTPIHQIQGAASTSPIQGKTVTTQGVVMGVIYANSKQPQLLIQSQQADDSAATSEALLIPDVELARIYQRGQLLELAGTVRELEDMTALTNITHSKICAEQLAVKATPFTLPVQQLSDWEALEGHWLKFSHPLVVNDSYHLARFGELLVADQRLFVSTELHAPGEAARAFEQQQLLRQLVIDDDNPKQNPDPIRFPTGGLTADNPVRVGDTLSDVEGFFVQTKAGYRLVVSKQPQFAATNPRPLVPAAKQHPQQLRVASFNVLNFFNGVSQDVPFPTKRGASNAEEFQRQQAKMIAALAAMDADIIGLLEVENNGYGKTAALSTLVSLLNQQLGQEVYRAIQTEAKPGTDDIKVAMIYRPATVTTLGAAAMLNDATFARGNRVPIAQTFQHIASGKNLTVSINHFKSKGSCPKQQNADSDQGDGQSCWNATRVKAAKTLSQWLATHPTGQTTNQILIMGDLNAYRMEDPIKALEQAGYRHLSSQGLKWSYVFRGRSGNLDHALASPTLADHLQSFQHWHINADEPVALDYNIEHKSAKQQQLFYAPTPFRSSDHDPLLMDFSF